MAPWKIEKARSSTLVRPVVRSAAASTRLATSLRRLGADERTVAQPDRAAGQALTRGA